MANKTLFFEVHKELGAKMAPCGIWDMPHHYPGGAIAEARNCRSGAGIFDSGNRLLIRFAGVAAEVANATGMPVAEMAVAEVIETVWQLDGIAVPVVAGCMAEGDFLVVCAGDITAAAAEKAAAALPQTVTMQILSEALGSFMLMGANASAVMSDTAAGGSVPERGYWSSLNFCDEENEQFRAIIFHHTQWDLDAYTVICNAEIAVELYGIFYQDNAVTPIGTSAFEMLRQHAENGGE